MKLTYLDQAIPSVYGMPKFNDIMPPNLTEKTFEDKNFLKFESSIDYTGKRTNSYYYYVRVLSTTR